MVFSSQTGDAGSGMKMLGYDPDGRPVFNPAELPEIESFEVVYVGESHIEINGWVFPYRLLSRDMLRWWAGHMNKWQGEDPERMKLIDAIALAFEERLSGPW